MFLLPSVFGVGVEGAGLHADSSNAFQTVGTAELRCSTLLMPHVPQQLQQRCRVESRGLWKCISPKFRGDWKNITIFFVGWTCLLIINFFFWVYLGDSVTKPLHPTVSCCFAHGSITGCTERPFGGETTQPFWQEGSKCWYVLQLGEAFRGGAVPDDFGDLVVFGEMRFVFHSGVLVGGSFVICQQPVYPLLHPGTWRCSSPYRKAVASWVWFCSPAKAQCHKWRCQQLA